MTAKELPATEYVRLRTRALGGASARLGPRIRNPRITANGWAPSLLTIVEQQRDYLRKHPGSHRDTPSNSSDQSSAQDNAERKTLTPPNHWGSPEVESQGFLMAAQLSPSCLMPEIVLVNGRAAEAVFTPQPPDNLYRIEGCGFGAKPGEVWIGSDSRTIHLQLNGSDAWSDTEIIARLDPNFSGLSDSSVRLIVQRADDTRLEFPGCHFLAVRGPATVLKTIPASWVKLDATMASLHPIRQLEFLSPPLVGDEVPGDATKASALIVRSDTDQFGSGADYYDFSALPSGWIVESLQILRYPGICPGDVTRVKELAGWKTVFDAHGFRVDWSSNSCSSFVPPVFRFSMTSSEYAVKVWVVGPVGTEAIAGGDRSRH